METKIRNGGAIIEHRYLYIAQNAEKRCSYEVKELLYTLVMLSKLAYEPSERRTPKTVLIMYNIPICSRKIKKGGASPFDNLDQEGLNLEIAMRNVETLRKDEKDPTKDQLKTASLYQSHHTYHT